MSAEGLHDGEPVLSRYAQDRLIGPLLVEFVKDLAPQVDALASATASADLAELGRLSHKLKGEAATYGYPELARLASAVEELARRGSPADPAQLTELMNALRLMALRVQMGVPSA